MAENNAPVSSVTKEDIEKSLRDLNLSEEDIQKAVQDFEKSESTEELDNKGENNASKDTSDSTPTDLEKSISDKKEELRLLEEKQTQLKKSEEDQLGSQNSVSDSLNPDLIKSITEEVGKDVGIKLQGITSLFKGISDELQELKKTNEKLVEDNGELKKSLTDSYQAIEKISSFTPGLKSVGTQNYLQRFEKSESSEEGDKKTLSVTHDKSEIQGLLLKSMSDDDFLKKHGNDCAAFETSNTISKGLEKALKDEFGISLTM